MESASKRRLLTTIRARLIAGLITILPAALTIWVFLLVIGLADSIAQPIIRGIFGEPLPGAGIVLALLVLYLVGAIVSNRILKQIIGWGEGLLHRFPLVGPIYSAIKQTVAAFNVSDAGDKFNRVVFVEYPKENSWGLAFVTRELFFMEKKMLCVFIPTTPNPTSGFLLLVEEANTVATNMTVDTAAKFVVSAGLVTPDDLKTNRGPILMQSSGLGEQSKSS